MRLTFAPASVLLVALGSTAGFAHAQNLGSLDIPDQIDGYPTNVGFLILGHSTSAQGQYPAKLVAALNSPAHVADSRHYSAFTAITGGDGGLLWSIVSVAPTDTRYDRATASSGVTESPQPQWCEDASGLRWSCRRAKVEHLLTGTFPIPSSGSCADPSVAAGCMQASTLACTWYDRTLPLAQNPVTQTLTPQQCWQRMDYRIALLQDTSNRSWPIDDSNVDGLVDGNDAWSSARILRSRALPCPTSSGVIGGLIDWNCDLAIDAADAAPNVYATWLGELCQDLLSTVRYGAAAVDAVIVTQKPLEMGQCGLWPVGERNACLANPHTLRTPTQIASTPDRPLDHYYAPTVYWEHRAVETLFAQAGLDPRILPATPADSRAMWNRSALCYAAGLSSGDWRIPAGVVGLPSVVAADDAEVDSGPGTDSASVGCLVSDHIHHNDNGGWMMADVWYDGLSGPLWSGVPDRVFVDGFDP